MVVQPILPKFSNCDLHNRVKNGEELVGGEAVKHGFCKEPNAYRCSRENCQYHVNINK